MNAKCDCCYLVYGIACCLDPMNQKGLCQDGYCEKYDITEKPEPKEEGQ